MWAHKRNNFANFPRPFSQRKKNVCRNYFGLLRCAFRDPRYLHDSGKTRDVHCCVRIDHESYFETPTATTTTTTVTTTTTTTTRTATAIAAAIATVTIASASSTISTTTFALTVPSMTTLSLALQCFRPMHFAKNTDWSDSQKFVVGDWEILVDDWKCRASRRFSAVSDTRPSNHLCYICSRSLFSLLCRCCILLFIQISLTRGELGSFLTLLTFAAPEFALVVVFHPPFPAYSNVQWCGLEFHWVFIQIPVCKEETEGWEPWNSENSKYGPNHGKAKWST